MSFLYCQPLDCVDISCMRFGNAKRPRTYTLWGLKVRGLTTSLRLIQKESSVKELSLDQISEVSGGVLPLLGALAFVYYERNEIADFVGGALDGFNGTDHMAPN